MCAKLADLNHRTELRLETKFRRYRSLSRHVAVSDICAEAEIAGTQNCYAAMQDLHVSGYTPPLQC